MKLKDAALFLIEASMSVMSLLWLTETATIVLFIFTVVLVLSSYISRWWMSLKFRRLPPGPFCWPLVGFVPAFSTEAISDRLQELSIKFNGIFGFYLGSRYVVFINDFQALKTAFSRQEFLGRPPGVLNLSPDKFKTGVADANGPEWKEMKRFWQNSIRSLGGNSQAFRSELQNQISLLREELGTKGGEDVDVHRLLEHPLFNLSFFLTYGKTFERGHRMLDLVHEFNQAFAVVLGTNLMKYIFTWFGKILGLLPVDLWIGKTTDRVEVALSKYVRNHKQNLDPNDPRDFADLFLLQMQKPGMDLIFNEKSLLFNSMEVMLGFTVSICTHLEWFLLNMAAHPEIQAAIQDKIDSAVGRERETLLTDRTLLTLLDAAILESMRFRYFGTVIGFRSVQKDTTLCGYDIPKDTLVFCNAIFLFRDPKYWPDPHRFDPNRFLSSDCSSLNVPEHFIPYGVGKRTSLGESSSGPVMFLFAANLLQRFRILPSDAGINLDVNYSLVNKPVHPFVKFQKRY